MDMLKPHPLEAETDKIINDLGGDLTKMKEVFDTGTMYRLNWDDIPLYIGLPTYVPTRASNIVRIEFTLDEVAAKDVGRILFAISLDQDMNRNFPNRVVPRTKDERTYEIILQSVCEVDLVREDFVSSTILYAADICRLYRDEFLEQEVVA